MVRQPFGKELSGATVAAKDEDYYIWDCSVIAWQGKYHLFVSRWPRSRGFGWNWLFRSEVARYESSSPTGPFQAAETVLPARGESFFDGRNTHNPRIVSHQGKFYLYYMGTTYPGKTPAHADRIGEDFAARVYRNKRIGLAVADSPLGPWIRMDRPILSPRPGKWDGSMTTNPAVAILPDGTTYLMYKARADEHAPLQLGMAVAGNPEGPFERLCEGPILRDLPSRHIEDPFLWFDQSRHRFCLLAKDACSELLAEAGAGFYAESEDGIRFELATPPKAYSRKIRFADGTVLNPVNLERPSLLFENGVPAYLYFAMGTGKAPYQFDDATSVVCVPLR